MYTRRNLPEFRFLRLETKLKNAVLLAAKIVKRGVCFSLLPFFVGFEQETVQTHSYP